MKFSKKKNNEHNIFQLKDYKQLCNFYEDQIIGKGRAQIHDQSFDPETTWGKQQVIIT